MPSDYVDKAVTNNAFHKAEQTVQKEVWIPFTNVSDIYEKADETEIGGSKDIACDFSWCIELGLL